LNSSMQCADESEDLMREQVKEDDLPEAHCGNNHWWNSD